MRTHESYNSPVTMEARRDPEAFLERARQEEARRARGKLKVFFGAAAGVGKTYAMLEAAREQRVAGVDVVAGVVETHKRAAGIRKAPHSGHCLDRPPIASLGTNPADACRR